MLIVIEVDSTKAVLWDGEMKDEWGKPVYHTLTGDFSGIVEKDDLVELHLRKVVHSD